MMKYETFKQIIATQIKDNLPPVFQSFEVKFIQVQKTNEVKEAMVLRPKDIPNYGAVPNIYLEDMYQQLEAGSTLSEILEQIATVIMCFTGVQVPEVTTSDLKEMTDRIIPTLVNTEKNRTMLENVPHYDMLDLSIVYRFVVKKNEGSGFMSSLITYEIQDCLELSMEKLHEIAMRNMENIFPVRVWELTETLNVLTNDFYMYGAVGLLYMDKIKEIADKMQSDLYLVPSSIHEIMVMAVDSSDIHELIDILNKGNNLYTEEGDYLSEEIYYYEHDTGEMYITYLD